MTRASRILIVALGILLGQFILFWPSLIGTKILLPLEDLSVSTTYLPHVEAYDSVQPFDWTLTDLITHYEPQRVFAAKEIRAGRWPMWMPFQYCGTPLVWPKYSPFNLLALATPSPKILAWVQVFESLVAGLGMYAFVRAALRVSFWPAAAMAWCFPLTAFFVFWQGFSTSASIYWMGWLMLAVNRTVRKPRAITALGLSLATCLVLISGNIDVAAQLLLASGLYAIWCLFDARKSGLVKPVLVLGGSWILGLMLATPHVLPLIEYVKTGVRFASRESGVEERPPVGLSSLPRMLLPDMYGTTHAPSLHIVPRNQIESTAAAYCGIIAMLFLAPLSWRSRRHRSFMIFAVVMILLGLSWQLDFPLITSILRWPFLRLMSHSRLVFVSAFFMLALAAIGLDALWRGKARFAQPYWIFAATLATACVWCVYRATHLPEPVATQLLKHINAREQGLLIATVEDLVAVRRWFVQSYWVWGAFCAAGLIAWLALFFAANRARQIVFAMAVLLLVEGLWFAHGRRSQADPALYYPPIGTLQQIARNPSDRFVGCGCLQASVAATNGVWDVRGYDAIDPANIVKLLEPVAGPAARLVAYARVQFFIPLYEVFIPNIARVPPVLDMLGVRYLVFQGNPPEQLKDLIRSEDYFAIENPRAMPRAWVPGHVGVLKSDADVLAALTSNTFEPGAVAYVDSPISLPEDCKGAARIDSETPTRLTLSLDMQTSGLVVLRDRWDAGWKAYLNGQRVPIVKTNYALRGVIAPAGKGTLDFVYQPTSFVIGICLAAGAGLILGAWTIVDRRSR